MNKSIRFLVTGAAGFIGSHIVERILDLNYTVTATDLIPYSSAINLDFVKNHPNRHLFSYFLGDITDFAFCCSVCKNQDFILHQAGLTSVEASFDQMIAYHLANTTGTLTLLKAAAQSGIQKFILASSAAVYGNTASLPVSEFQNLQPESPYALNKKICEDYAHLFWKNSQLFTCALRYFNVYGPRQNPHSSYSGVISKFIQNMLTNQSIKIFGSGEQTRDFVFVKDIAKLNIELCLSPVLNPDKAINIGSGTRVSILTLAQMLQQIMQTQNNLEFKPPRIGDILHSQANILNLREILPKFEFQSLESGLKETLQWAKE